MVNYKAVGNSPLSDIFGDKAGLLLKMMNQCKETTLELVKLSGKPYVWNGENYGKPSIPKEWAEFVAGKVGNELMKDEKWKWSIDYIHSLRKEMMATGIW